MADDVSIGEVWRRQQEHEQRTDRVHAELDNRLTALARESVSQHAFEAALRAQERELARVEREQEQGFTRVDGELKELRERPQLTAGRVAVLATAVIALLALVVQAYGTLKGAK